MKARDIGIIALVVVGVMVAVANFQPLQDTLGVSL